MNKGEVIWVTGASSGIGRCLTLQLADLGCTVIASARNKEALEQLARVASVEHRPGKIVPLAYDLNGELDIDDLRAELQFHSLYLDRVIINAGRCEYLDFPDPDWTAIDRVMSVNFHGSVKAIEAALPLLKMSSLTRTQIVGVVSQVVFAPFQRSQAYGASKAAFSYFLDSLRLDLDQDGIDVCAVYPGFVKTPMTAANDFDMPFLIEPDDMASRIVQCLGTPKQKLIYPRRLYWLLKLLGSVPAIWKKVVVRDLDKSRHQNLIERN